MKTGEERSCKDCGCKDVITVAQVGEFGMEYFYLCVRCHERRQWKYD